MEKLIDIVKSKVVVIDFFTPEGDPLREDKEIMDYIRRTIYSKKDGEMLLVLASKKAYNRAKRLLDDESRRIGINYDL
jgi:hypothetical protein